MFLNTSKNNRLSVVSILFLKMLAASAEKTGAGKR
jgi:hypothetical protein